VSAATGAGFPITGAVVNRRARRPARIDVRRLGWGRELALVALLYGLYMAARAVIGVPVADATARGRDIIDLEGLLGLDVERPFNAFLTAVPPLGLLAAYLYATLHYVVTPAVLGWVALRRRPHYRTARNGLVFATAMGLVGYWLLPTAPPRLVDGALTDTMARFSGLGWWGDAASAPRGMEALSNQYAAMPSLHVGWAVWVALRRRPHYRTARNGLLLATAMGLVGYWLLPTAPPRLVDGGLTDTMAHFSGLGWWGDAASAPRGMEALSNQYAAMPSLHVGWAVWVALVLHRHAGSALVRRWAWTYPAVMGLVVVSTANHYTLDAVAGAAVAIAGVALARRLSRPRPTTARPTTARTTTARPTTARTTAEGHPDEHPRAAAPSADRGAGDHHTLDPHRAVPGRPRAHDLASHHHRPRRAGGDRRPGGRGRPRRAGAAPARPQPAHLLQPRPLVDPHRRPLAAPLAAANRSDPTAGLR
jgi:hypothetical protein